MEIQVMKRVLDRNQDKADTVRAKLKDLGIVMINFISSPGTGKTSLLDLICRHLKDRFRLGIIEGDVATDRDAQRLKQHDLPIVLINTDGGCHLDSNSIEKALEKMPLESLDAIFVENVGNLVCPTAFDLGEDFKFAMVSTSEGDDKPIKYPMLFREARGVVLNKIDLIPHTDFNREDFERDLRLVNPRVSLFPISCRTHEGVDNFMHWFENEISMGLKKL